MTDVTDERTDVAAETRLGVALTPSADQPGNANTALSYRTVSSHSRTAENLGPLADLPGWWEGTGFSIIARPDFDADNKDGFFLQLNLLRETIEFRSIGSPIPNRGSVEPDQYLYGVTYLHRVTDAATGSALHIEPGVWLNMPADDGTSPATTVARLSNIPHGNSFAAVGFVEEEVPEGAPEIPPANTIPYDVGAEPPAPGSENPFAAYDLSVDTPYRTSPLPETITQSIIDDPNQFIRDALRGQTLSHITRLITSTDACGGVSNIPFITSNADAQHVTSVFAIERVRSSPGTEVLQLGYSQTALLMFRGKYFPHVTVGKLVKAF